MSVSVPDVTPRSRADDSPLAIMVLVAALLAVVGLVLVLWLPFLPHPASSMERYAPLAHGAAFSFRVTQPDGKITYRSRNIERTGANENAGELPLAVFTAMVDAAGIDILQLGAAEALNALAQFELVQIRDTDYDAAGNLLARSRQYVLVKPEMLAQVGVDEIGINPPLPLLPTGDASESVVGKLNDTVPFSVTQQIDRRGAFNSALGAFPDCIQVSSETRVNDAPITSTSWYCAGVGLVHDTTTDASGTTTHELIAAHVSGFIRGSAPIFITTGEGATLQQSFDQPLSADVKPRLNYKEPTSSQGITTAVLPLPDKLLYGTYSGALVALDPSAAKEIWRFQTGSPVYSTPIVANGIAYFGSADKHVYAVRAQDGAFVWAFPTRDVVSASPAAAQGTVYVASEDGNLYALDADTGKPRWSFSSPGPLVASPVVAGDRVLATNDDGALYALNPETGHVIWSFAANGAITAPVTVVGAKVYFGAYDETVYALNLQDGTLIWSHNLGDTVENAVVVRDGRAYVVLPSEIFALDAATGSSVWRYASADSLVGAPLLLGNQLWALAGGALVQLDAQTGARVQEIPASESTVNAGLSTDGREIFVGFFDGNLKSLGGAP